jgi:hypothetical protein
MTPNRFLSVSIALLLATMSPNARAFFDPPWITPAFPRVGQAVSVNIRGGICDSIFFRPGYPQITQQGNAIRILEYGHHWETSDLCAYDIGTLTEPIGTYPPGDYTLTVDFIYEDYPFGYTTLALGVVPFVVTDAKSVTPIPVVSWLWKFMLLALIFGVAIRTLQIRLRSNCCTSRIF